MKLREIADRIAAHLRRFEADKEINKYDPPRVMRGLRPYYGAGAGVVGAYVWVVYISYQGGDNLRRADAERYLAWLDAGNVGRHFEARRSKSW